MHYRIQDLNEDEKPREKILSKGPASMTDGELVALVLGTGGKNLAVTELSRELLKNFNGLGGLLSAEPSELIKMRHMGSAKACSIRALGEIIKRVTFGNNSGEKKEIKKPRDVYDILKKDLFDNNKKEHLYLLSLNSRNVLIGKDIISMGTVNETVISPRDIFQKALKRDAVFIIMAHNHPSNEPAPSSEDIKATEMVAQTGKVMGVPLIDHVIICDTGFVSMKSLNLFKTFSEKTETAMAESTDNYFGCHTKGGDKNAL